MNLIKLFGNFLIVILISYNIVLAQQKERVINFYKWKNEPVVVLAVKVKSNIIKPKEKFVDNDDNWFSSLTVDVKNISNKTIANIQIAIDFPREEGMTKSPIRDYLWYGTNNLSIPNQAQPPLNPGSIATLKIGNYQSLREFLDRNGHSRSLKEFRLSIDSVLFTDDTKWSVGQIFRRDPNNLKRWIPEKRWRSLIRGGLENNLNLDLFKAASFTLLPFFSEEYNNQIVCYEIFSEEPFNCPSACEAHYHTKGAQLPPSDPDGYRFDVRNIRCKNSQNENCDNNVYEDQNFAYLNCTSTGSGCEQPNPEPTNFSDCLSIGNQGEFCCNLVGWIWSGEQCLVRNQQTMMDHRF